MKTIETRRALSLYRYGRGSNIRSSRLAELAISACVLRTIRQYNIEAQFAHFYFLSKPIYLKVGQFVRRNIRAYPVVTDTHYP